MISKISKKSTLMALTVSAALAIGLAGCGKKSGPQSEDAPKNTTTAPSTSQAAPTNPDAPKVGTMTNPDAARANRPSGGFMQSSGSTRGGGGN